MTQEDKVVYIIDKIKLEARVNYTKIWASTKNRPFFVV